jgi:hypothetical protein
MRKEEADWPQARSRSVAGKINARPRLLLLPLRIFTIIEPLRQ